MAIQRILILSLVVLLAAASGCSGDDASDADVLRLSVSAFSPYPEIGCAPVLPGGQPLPGTISLFVNRVVELDEAITSTIQWEQEMYGRCDVAVGLYVERNSLEVLVLSAPGASITRIAPGFVLLAYPLVSDPGSHSFEITYSVISRESLPAILGG